MSRPADSPDSLLARGMTYYTYMDLGIGADVKSEEWTSNLDSRRAGDRREVAAEEKKPRGVGECKVCFEARVETAILPCAHACACHDCATSLNECPICRGIIESLFRFILS